MSLEPLRASLQARLPPGLSIHGLCEVLGVSAALALFVVEARRRRRLDDDLVLVLLGALIGGGLASRLATLPRYLELAAAPSFMGALLHGGQSVLGGLAGAYLGAVLAKRLIGYQEGTGDIFVPGVALGIAVGRLGCLLEEPPGTPSGGGWGLLFPAERAAAFPDFPPAWVGVPLHPSFAYEIVFHLALFGLLLRWRRTPRLAGKLLKLYLLCYAVFRFGVEFVRGNPELWAGLSRSQWFLVPSIALLVLSSRSWLRAGHGPAREVPGDG